MKANLLLRFLLLLVLNISFQVPAQQSEADRKLLADIRSKAEKGDAQSQSELGSAFFFGNLGVAEDYVEAVKWYRKAAEQGIAKAQVSLGICYAQGQGVVKDDVEGVNWFRKAAEQGLANAQVYLGACYAEGRGVVKDDFEAAKWYRKAAEQNEPNAQCNLGVCCEKGEGVAKNDVEAVKWFRKAAGQGLVKAQFNLGNCYARGKGVVKDDAEAAKWYRKAAEQNYALAQVNLSICIGNGRGVPKDYVEAYKWVLLAAAQGYEDAQESMDLLERMMTREQIAEGQRLARVFKPRRMPSPADGSPTSEVGETRPESSGTGFFITEDGFLVTNEHVVRGAAGVRLVTSTGLIAAEVWKLDSANDLALLKASGRFVALPVSPSRSVRLGNTVATVGFPNIGLQGFAPKLAKGEIAALSGAQDDPKYFQISVPLQPGNSGGALVDERGAVVGVVAAKLNVAAAVATSGAMPENVNYAVKSSFLLGFLESVPDVSAKLKEPSIKECKFEDVVKSAEKAAVLVLVY